MPTSLAPSVVAAQYILAASDRNASKRTNERGFMKFDDLASVAPFENDGKDFKATDGSLQGLN